MSSSSNEIVDRFSTHLKNVLTRALCFVVENGQTTILPEHMLWAIGTERGCIGAELLKKTGVKIEGLRELTSTAASSNGKSSSEPIPNPASPQLSEAAKHAIEKAVLTANAHRHRYVGTEHLLAGLVQIRLTSIERFFQQTKINLNDLGEQISFALRSASRYPDLTAAIAPVPAGPMPSPLVEERLSSPQALSVFGRELTAPEMQKKLDPVIGRAQEIERVMEILCRRNKNNPLLLGEPGVGKTAIVEGLAKRIHAGTIPPALRGKRLISIDLASMIAGTMYRGEFEQRMRHVIDEARKQPDIILFIDEIHTIVGAGAASGSLDAANILKPALARGELRCIGATTFAEFKKHMETDAALERRFQGVTIQEPSPAQALTILQGLASAYETHHHVRFTPEALEAAVRLSLRFLQDRRLPDKAIDLMDEAGAAVRVRATLPGPAEQRRALERHLEELRERKQAAVLHEQFQQALELKAEEARVEEALHQAEQVAQTSETSLIDEQQIAAVVSRMSGLSLADVLHDSADPEALETMLKSRIFGQDQTVRAVSRAVSRAKAGLNDPRRPLASFLFIGPSGVGKTELAKALAEGAFKDAKALVRLDMSEYAESFTASKLMGAPAGYVGYKDGAKLTDRVRQRPHCVVLFDEIEKAHPDVQNLLLQLLEEGELTDASGLSVSFRNAIVVLTSNAGADRLRQGAIGFGSGAALTIGDMRHDLEERFRPELLNRIEHTLLFEPLSAEALQAVARAQINELVARLTNRGRTMNIGDDVAAFLAARVNATLGARDMRRLIQTEIEDRIAHLLTGAPKEFHVTVADGSVAVSAT